ncbi:MAG: hypothetical protein WKF80_11785, partial [Thermomicrobiales bacterium]
THGTPARVVDPGTGSGRFLVAAGRAFPSAELVGIDLDPFAALLARGHLAAAGMADRARVITADFRAACLPPIDGRTLYLGNPPYVRHHQISPEWKAWLTATARRHGLRASQLAGLHAHFFLAIAETARPGDTGVLITAAEWLDVNYGRFVQSLLLEILGLRTLVVIEPTADPFPGTATTAVITGFTVGERPATVGVRRVETSAALSGREPERAIARADLAATGRWSILTRGVPERREGFVELGEICRVHRGQVTGANRVWVTDAVQPEGGDDLPASVLFPAVTRARELIAAGTTLADDSALRRVIDLPVDLDTLAAGERERVERFLRSARERGADKGFIAEHRRAWWAVGLRAPAPILATYMARRPPAFVLNRTAARHINIAHGLYPREPMGEAALRALAEYLSGSVRVGDGRTYAGGLTKFEPREMERLLVPAPGAPSSVSATRLAS